MPIAKIHAMLKPDSPGIDILPEYRVPWKKAVDKIRAVEAKRGERLEFVLSVEWHVRKRSYDQLKLFYWLLRCAAQFYRDGPDDKDFDEDKWVAQLYEDYLQTYGPREEVVVTSATGEAVFRERFGRIIERKEKPNGGIYLKAIIGASMWDMQQAYSANDRWINELASVGIDIDTGKEKPEFDDAIFSEKWREWKLESMKMGCRVFGDDDDISEEDYKKAVPICEGCGKWLGGDGGELAHIKARGMGDAMTKKKDCHGNWLHLCIDCHRFGGDGKESQHQKGWGVFLKQAPWLKDKVEKALAQ